MVQVSNTLALGAASTQMMDVYAGHHPQWKESLFWMPMGRSTPQQANWRVVRNILGDAGWQTFQTYITAEDIPAILTQLDEMIIEVLRHLE